jgi:hypothetical protein
VSRKKGVKHPNPTLRNLPALTLAMTNQRREMESAGMSVVSGRLTRAVETGGASERRKLGRAGACGDGTVNVGRDV